MKSSVVKKLIWAVDALEPVEFQENAECVLGALTRNSSIEIYPVYVCNQIRGVAASSVLDEACAALAEKRMKLLGQRSEIQPFLKEGATLINDNYNIRSSVKTLLEYARDNKAGAIIVSTHSRGAVEKFFLGSFAETLLMQSEIPIITVNPETLVREKISKVLLPTSFESSFRPAFEEALKLCASLDASLTVFFKEPFIPMIEISFELVQLLESESEMRKKEALEYGKIAERYRVPLEIKFDSKPGKIAESIVELADEENFDLIVMTSQASPHGPHVGSIGRKVVRRAAPPVWSFMTDKKP